MINIINILVLILINYLKKIIQIEKEIYMKKCDCENKLK